MKYIKNRIISDGSFLSTENGYDIFNPSHEDYINDGWQEYLEDTEESGDREKTLEETRGNVLLEVEDYYRSNSVSGFFIGDRLFNLPPASERMMFVEHIKAYIEAGKDDSTFVFDGITLTVIEAFDMLMEMMVYSTECYLNYLNHVNNIKKLLSETDILDYDFTTGYPDVLRF